ncbi:MAG: HAMP domain-containing histidine kinase [Candidatus Marinimicrobia bacterium]|nr:HAMP domain-containing histidine kinase [Candidatus Neomarinimicrobiota bacterium]
MYWSLFPIWLLDVSGSLIMIVMSFLCLGLAREIFHRDPEDALSAYLLWFCFAIFAFSLSRSLGHIIKHVLYFADLEYWWQSLSPFSGSINSITFVVIGAITLFFNRMEIIIHRVARDKEKIEKTSSELLKLNRDMEDIVSERTWAEMALRIAHEVRNPVTIIGGLVRRLQKKVPKDIKEQVKLENVLVQIEKLESLILHFEGLVSEKKKHFTTENLCELIQEAREIVLSDAAEKGVAIIYTPEARELSMQTDARLIKVVIVHLLRNAIAACNAGASVDVKVCMHDSWLELTIRDTGKGIPPDVLPYIFEPFYTNGEIKTGLGLPYIQQIIKQHRGILRIESKVGAGTQVTIRVPALLGELIH